MKKIVIMTLAAALVAMAMTACSDKAADTTTANTEAKTEASAEANTADTATSDQESILEKDADGNFIKPENYGTVTKLGEYKGLEVTLGDATITDEEVETEIQSMLASNAETTEVDRAAALGDVCSIDYVGKKDGVAFDGGTGSYDLELGSHSFIEGFEDGLVGAKKGDVKELNLTFPENYGVADLAGADVVFTVTVNAVKEKKTPELTDAWVESYTSGELKTVDEFKTSVRGDLEEYRKLDVESTAKNELVSKVLEASEITASVEAIEYEYQTMIKTYDQYAAAAGMTTDEYLNAYGVDPSAMKIQLSYYAEESVKQRLMEEEIFKAEGMSMTDADYQALADLYGYDTETMKSLYGEENFESYAKSYKVVNYIFDNAKIK